MEIKYNNVAGRLLAILEEARLQKSNDSTATVWATTFSADVESKSDRIQQQNLPEIYRRLVLLHESLSEIEEIISIRCPNEKHLYLRDFVKLKSAVAPPDLRQQWQQYRNQLTDAGMMALELCAKELPQEGEVTREELNAILTAVHDLRQQVLKSEDLPKHLKEWILELLAMIQKGVEAYWIQGSRKLRQTLALIAGAMSFNPAAQSEAKKNHAPFWMSLIGIFKQLLIATKKGKEISGLIEYYTDRARDLLSVDDIGNSL